MVVARRVENQGVCLHNVEFQSSGLACHRVRFGRMGFHSVDTDMSAVVGAVAVVDVAAAAADSVAVIAVVVVVVVVVVAGPAPGDLRRGHLDRIASTFFDVSYQKTIQSGLKFFVLSE